MIELDQILAKMQPREMQVVLHDLAGREKLVECLSQCSRFERGAVVSFNVPLTEKFLPEICAVKDCLADRGMYLGLRFAVPVDEKSFSVFNARGVQQVPLVVGGEKFWIGKTPAVTRQLGDQMLVSVWQLDLSLYLPIRHVALLCYDVHRCKVALPELIQTLLGTR